MPLFRPHMGSLKESLRQTILVKNIAEIKKHILDNWQFNLKHDPDIRVSDYCHGAIDFRCGWYTQLVSMDLIEKGFFHPMGYLSEPFPEK